MFSSRSPLLASLLAAALVPVAAGGALAIPGGPAPRETASLVLAAGYYGDYTAYPQRRRHTANGGYHVNRMGYGNYTRGTNGGFGGYPAGSAGAQILQEQQQRKCIYEPETC